jgi:hypothetical protein
MTVTAEADERIPPVVAPEYETYPRVYWVNDHLIVFRCDQYTSAIPKCVARMPSGERCNGNLPECGFAVIQIVGSDASVEAGITSQPDCLIRQRCPEHVHSGGEDILPPDWKPFDPEQDTDALHYIIPRWSPAGVWLPPEHDRGQHLQIWHRDTCEAGDHVPLISKDDDEDEDEDREGGEDTAPAAPTARPAPRPSIPSQVEAEAECGPTALYRYFDADDLLLYIGISDRLRIRTGDHVKGSSWMDFAVRSTIERHPTRAVALEVEEAAIKAERPLFNKQHNDTPEARRALVEYLIKHDRLDLLAPAVSRG